MTYEQFIIYLYGIYPTGGITVAAIIIAMITISIYIITTETEDLPKTFADLPRKIKVIVWVTVSTMVIGYFIPSKNAFLAIVATPLLMESAKDGRLDKIDQLLDMALAKAQKKITETEKE